MIDNLEAKFSISRNDMTWRYYCCEFLWWRGYNDAYWWENVPQKNEDHGYNTRECSKCHKKYKIHYCGSDAPLEIIS
jgi:hypothetical protein